MKNFISKAVVGLSLFGATCAFADFNTDATDGPVTCTGSGVSVKINANRTAFIVTTRAGSELFSVKSRDSDGDTEVTYTAAGQQRTGKKNKKVQAQLSFDDRGDSLTLGGQDIDLKCPQ